MALALVSARYPQPSRMMRIRGLGRDISRRVPAPALSVRCLSNLQRRKGLHSASQVAASCGQEPSHDAHNPDGVTASGCGCKLSSTLVAKTSEQPDEFVTGKITRQSQVEMTSSFTVCRRITGGAVPASK